MKLFAIKIKTEFFCLLVIEKSISIVPVLNKFIKFAEAGLLNTW